MHLITQLHTALRTLAMAVVMTAMAGCVQSDAEAPSPPQQPPPTAAPTADGLGEVEEVPAADSVVAGQPAVGRLIPAEVLTGAVWDGELLWVADTEAGLTGFDPVARTVRRSTLPFPVGDGLGLVLLPDGALVGLALDPSTRLSQVLRIDRATGEASVQPVSEGRPGGQGFLQGGRVLVADYQRGVVDIEPATGASRQVAAAPFIPNLLAAGPDGSFWIVDDARARLVRLGQDGRILTDLDAQGYVGHLVSDSVGRAWLAQGERIVTVDADGRVVVQPETVANASHALLCGTTVVVSDTERGDLLRYPVTGSAVVTATGRPGRAVACHPDGVWYLTDEGDVALVAMPLG